MMLRVLLFTIMGLAIAGFGGVAWYSLRTPAPAQLAAEPPPPPPPHQPVLVAARPMRAGALVKPEDIGAQDMLVSASPADARADTQPARAEMIGAMVRRSLAQGEPLLPSDLLRPGDRGFLAAVLKPGMRATTVAVDAVSGTAGLIWPGDVVDLILTQMQDDPALPLGRRASAETLLSGVQVIAIDQHLMQGAVGSGPDQGVAHTVTLEVTPTEAERVAVAARLGRLSLAVRAAQDEAGPARGPAGTTWGGDVSPALNQQAHGAGQTLRLFLGKTDGKEFKF